jgi:hypothetical protein
LLKTSFPRASAGIEEKTSVSLAHSENGHLKMLNDEFGENK